MLYDPNEVIIELLQRILSKLNDIAFTLDSISSDTSNIDLKIDY